MKNNNIKKILKKKIVVFKIYTLVNQRGHYGSAVLVGSSGRLRIETWYVLVLKRP
jgi:hypothetical protein